MRLARLTQLITAVAVSLVALPTQAQVPSTNSTFNLLIFSKTLLYRHASITNGVAAIRKLGAENNFKVDATEDSGQFTTNKLAKYKVIVLLSTSGDVLNEEQQGAFQNWLRGGGGFVGIHAAVAGKVATEGSWPWYAKLFCTEFHNHPAIAQATVHVEDQSHPSTAHLPRQWVRTDEWYNYETSPRGKVRVLARLDETTYKGGTMGGDHPIAWCQKFEGGRIWYTGLGHTEASYSDPLFIQHLLGGIEFAAGSKEADCTPTAEPDLRALARRQTATHRFSTLFTAHDVKNHLTTEQGIDQAIDWCNRTAVTKVYVEAFRDGYQAERTALAHAKERFLAAGLEVSGCVTTTQIGKKSSRWNIIACYTDPPTQARLQSIFEFTASLFDEIMIDDFWFTDCACAECDAARLARKVTIGEKTFSVASDSWEDYRGELMRRVSRERVLGAAKRVNPRAHLIIKYPQWYDTFHERGYDVAGETADFDRIWVGTETRDYKDQRWGGTVQYEAYFIMRWLGGIGDAKCGGGWYDWLGTTGQTYIEQARQTVLAGARESLLFCYGGLQGTTGPKNIEALRANVPELLEVAKQVRQREIVGIAAYKPPNSHAENEKRVFDFVGMLGLPLVPCHEFPANAQAAFFSIHALKDPDLSAKLSRFVKAGRPVLLTDGLAQQLTNKVNLDAPNVHILVVKGDPKSLLQRSHAELDELRAPLLRPFKTQFSAPNGVALYLFSDGSWVVENFGDESVNVELNRQPLQVEARGWVHHWK